MRVLGIETSCDETGLAIYCSEHGLLAHTLHSQVCLHAPFGGVVPELAARDHLSAWLPLLQQTLQEAKLTLQDLAGIAYTSGPGLLGALLVGACIGRTLSWALTIPSLGVHHMEGHLMASMLEEQTPEFPFLALLVSGGHTQLVSVMAFGRYQVLGESLDDAAGEAFDKTAKLLGLSYPGGPVLAKLAEQGNPLRFHFSRPMLGRPGLDFSFSGLKTSARQSIAQHEQELDTQTKADIACAFEQAVVETLTLKCQRALKQTQLPRLVVAGGVGANVSLQASIRAMTAKLGVPVYFPRTLFCTDNGAMIAYVGCQRLQAGERDTEVKLRARWSLAELTALG